MLKNKDSIKFLKKVKLDIKALPFTLKELTYGMNVELEYSYISPSINITNDDLIMTGKIALAHLFEYPDYYVRLRKMEKEAKKYWKGRKKT